MAAVADVVVHAGGAVREVVETDQLVVAQRARGWWRSRGADAVEAAARILVDIAVDGPDTGEGRMVDVDPGIDDAGHDPLALRSRTGDGAAVPDLVGVHPCRAAVG